jgi:hypothetical protein
MPLEKQKIRNIAFVDGQNLYLGTKEEGWAVDHKKFRIYLHDKYHIDEAYYFMGFVSEDEQDLYYKLQKAGFILAFREHSSALRGSKKGNVDSDIIFEVMRKNDEYASSLYDELGSEFYDSLDKKDIRAKIEYVRK